MSKRFPVIILNARCADIYWEYPRTLPYNWDAYEKATYSLMNRIRKGSYHSVVVTSIVEPA